jgi:hypothetical protein
MAERTGEQGTGKHPHKSSEDPRPHTKESGGRGREEGEETRGESQRNTEGGEESDLKEREYRDEKGEIHHHTRTYMEQHEGEKEESGSGKGGRGGGEESGSGKGGRSGEGERAAAGKGSERRGSGEKE